MNDTKNLSNFRKMLRKRGVIRGEMEKLTVAGVVLNNNTAETKQQRSCGWSGASTTTQEFETGEKNRLEMFVRMDYDDVLTWNRRWAACRIENVGITTCRGQ